MYRITAHQLTQLRDENGCTLALYCPNIEPLSKGRNGSLALSSALTQAPDDLDLAIFGFVVVMADAEKLFGVYGDNPVSSYNYAEAGHETKMDCISLTLCSLLDLDLGVRPE